MVQKRGAAQQKCWLCGEKGHVQTACHKLQSGAAVRKCFCCGSEEHEASACELNAKPPSKEPARPQISRVISSGDGGAGRQSQRMSVIITTSPVPSNPSTMMIEAVLQSFSRVKGLQDCPLVIVCDGFKVAAKSTYKAGRVTEDSAERYRGYLENLESLLSAGGLPPGTKLVMLEGRNGQGLAVQAGIDHVDTPYVCIHQHDLEFMFDFHLGSVLDVLADDANDVKYIGLPLLCNLHYERIAADHHGVRVEPVVQGSVHLVPVIFWYDSTHISSVRQYREVVFGCEEPLRPGNFIEETFGIRQRNDIMSAGMAAHPKYGTYHLISHAADGSRRPIICHLGGNRFLTPEQRAERGYPSDPSVEAYPARVMTRKNERKVRHILDLVVQLAGAAKHAEKSEIRGVLASQLHEARLRGGASAFHCLSQTSAPRCN